MRENLSTSSNSFIALSTILCIALGLFGYFSSVYFELIVASILIVTVGLPHGATDLLLTKYLTGNSSISDTVSFLSKYLLVIFSYGVVWYLMPIVAFTVFIIISIYHFGQSNLNFIQTENRIIRGLAYVASGSFVILTPLCIHYDTAGAIIENMIGSTLLINDIAISALPRELFLINVWLIVFLFFNNWISKKDFLLQIIGISLLLLCFYWLPLIIGFTVYFVFWHSYGSMIDQIRFIKSKEDGFTWWQYYLNALPITIIAVLIIIGAFKINTILSTDLSIIEVFFVLLSMFTLPHILLIEQLYAQVKASLTTLRVVVSTSN
jgi:Brp/Blh family beta-carotene 15,15'-monooxygenase